MLQSTNSSRSCWIKLREDQLESKREFTWRSKEVGLRKYLDLVPLISMDQLSLTRINVLQVRDLVKEAKVV